MAEGSASVAGGQGEPPEVLSIGWHLKQGQELCKAYASAQRKAGDEKWAEFFGDLAESYGRFLQEGASKLRELTDDGGPAERSSRWWCRPPW